MYCARLPAMRAASPFFIGPLGQLEMLPHKHFLKLHRCYARNRAMGDLRHRREIRFCLRIAIITNSGRNGHVCN